MKKLKLKYIKNLDILKKIQLYQNEKNQKVIKLKNNVYKVLE